MPLPPLLLKERPTAPTAAERDNCTDDGPDGQLNATELFKPYLIPDGVAANLKDFARKLVNSTYDFRWPLPATQGPHPCDLTFTAEFVENITRVYGPGKDRRVPDGWRDKADTGVRAVRVSSWMVADRLNKPSMNIKSMHKWEAKMRNRLVGIARPLPSVLDQFRKRGSQIPAERQAGYLLKIEAAASYDYTPKESKNPYWSLNIPLYYQRGLNEVVHFEADHNKWISGLCNPVELPDGRQEMDGPKPKDQVSRFLSATARILGELDDKIEHAWLHDYAIVDDIPMKDIVEAVRRHVGTAITNEYTLRLARGVPDEVDANAKKEFVDIWFGVGFDMALREIATKKCWRVKYYLKLGAEFYTTDLAKADSTPDLAVAIQEDPDGKKYGVFDTRPMTMDECISHVAASIRKSIVGTPTRAENDPIEWFSEWMEKFKRDLRIWNHRATTAGVFDVPKWEYEGMVDPEVDLEMYKLGFEFKLDVKAQGDKAANTVGNPIVCVHQFVPDGTPGSA